MKTVGFIGTGRIGFAMIQCMLGKGYRVRIWNRTKEKAEPLVNVGAILENSIQDVFAKETVVFLSLGDGKDVLEVINKGKSRKGTFIVDTSTVDPKDTKKISTMLSKKGVFYLEAPVLSAPPHVQKGETSFILGGDVASKPIVRELLNPISANIIDAGSAEQASAAKIAYNLLHGIIVAGTVESMVLGKSLGLEPEFMRELFAKGTVNCGSVVRASHQVFSSEAKLITFSMRHRLKDSEIASSLAKRSRKKLPVHDAATAQYAKAVKKNLAEEAPPAIWKLY